MNGAVNFSPAFCPYYLKHLFLSKQKILLVANTAWNLWNYRRSLIRALEQAGFEIVLLAPEDGFEKKLVEPAKTRFIPLRQLSRRSFSPWQNLKLLLEFRQVFKHEQPELILLFTIKPNILGNLAAQSVGCNTLSVVEGLGHAGSHAARWQWLAAPLYRFALRHAAKVVFLNNDDAQEFLAHQLVAREQLAHLPGPGIDLEYFNVRPKSSGPLCFLFCGRLLQEKGIQEFLLAAKQLKVQYPEFVFQVLGGPDPGNPGSLTESEFQQFRQEKAVQFLGMTEDVRPFLANADVLVLPSYYREGVPRSVLEAMAMGKIIITTDTAGCRDTVEPGKNGLLIPARHPTALAQAMLQIARLTPEERQEMGAYSRQKVHREFSDEQVLPLFLQLIQQLVSQE